MMSSTHVKCARSPFNCLPEVSDGLLSLQLLYTRQYRVHNTRIIRYWRTTRDKLKYLIIISNYKQDIYEKLKYLIIISNYMRNIHVSISGIFSLIVLDRNGGWAVYLKRHRSTGRPVGRRGQRKARRSVSDQCGLCVQVSGI